MLDLRCHCGATSHIHETQLAELPPEVWMLGIRCSGCGDVMTVPASGLREGFTTMRRLGWIA
jgi:hypothetical protein